VNLGNGPQPPVVWALALDNDGKVLVGGEFDKAAELPGGGLVRLLPTGVPDQQFQVALDAGGEKPAVFALAVQTDGRILIGGAFSKVAGQTQANLARLRPDGTLDDSFRPTSAVGPVRAVALLPDGRLLAGGRTSAAGGFVVRLGPDGRPEPSFSATNVPLVSALCALPNGQLLVGGVVSSNWSRDLVRLNTNGSVDRTFSAAIPGPVVPGIRREILSLALDGQGRFLVGGNFSHCLVRLTSQGALDPTFEAGPLHGTNGVYVIVPQGLGRLLIAGGFVKTREPPCCAPYLVAGLFTDLPAETLELSPPEVPGHAFFLRHHSLAGKRYRIEYKNTLSDPGWSLLTQVDGQGTTRVIEDAAPPAPQRYFTVRSE
jgi:uncharacterized delta-60 repeat protein